MVRRETVLCLVIALLLLLCVYVSIYTNIYSLSGFFLIRLIPLTLSLTAIYNFINSIVVAPLLPRRLRYAPVPTVEYPELIETTGARVALYPFVFAELVGQHTGRISRIICISVFCLICSLLILR